MSDLLEPIKSYDIETIQYRTKIAPQYIKALLEHDFSKFTKVQFLGFVSILEREFNVELDAYKQEYFQQTGTSSEETPVIEDFVSKKEPKKKSRFAFILVVVLIIAVALFFGYKQLNLKPKSQPVVINNTEIIKAKEKLVEVQKQEEAQQEEQDMQESDDENLSESVAQELPPKIVNLPKRRVRMGLIDLETGKKTQKIIESAYDINSSKSWLMIFGHGRIDIEYDKELFEYTTRKKLWFMYKDGHLEEINREKFIKNNGGKAW
jgi:cytoskeletal protein RodZ